MNDFLLKLNLVRLAIKCILILVSILMGMWFWFTAGFFGALIKVSPLLLIAWIVGPSAEAEARIFSAIGKMAKASDPKAG